MTILRGIASLTATLTLMAYDLVRPPRPVRGWNPPPYTYEEQD